MKKTSTPKKIDPLDYSWDNLFHIHNKYKNSHHKKYKKNSK